MNRFLKRIALPAAIAVAAIASIPLAEARSQSEMDVQPGIVISIASIDSQFSDLETLVEASGFGQMKGFIRMGASEYIKGLDASRPAGAMLFFKGENPEPDVLAFVPVTDIEDVLDTLAQIADVDGEEGEYVITPDGGEAFHVRVVENTAFISPKKELFENLPADAAAQLEELPTEYNIAARIYGQRIPAELRQQMIDLIREGAESEMGNDDSPEAVIQRANLDYQMRNLEGFINETDELVAGLCIDETGKRVYLDIRLVGLPDSDFARQVAAAQDAPESRFGGFLRDDVAANLGLTSKVSEEDGKQAVAVLETLMEEAGKEIDKGVSSGELNAEEGASLKEALASVEECVSDTVSQGTIDMGAALSFDKDEVQFAAACTVAGSDKLEGALKKFAAVIEKKDAPVEFNFDAATENGVRWHEVTIPVPENEEEARGIFGEELTLHIGAGDDVVYMTAGKSGRDFLAQCLKGEAPSGERYLGQFNARLVPILRFASKVQASDEMSAILDGLPEDVSDRIRVSAKLIENGQLIRMEMENGVWEIVGKIGAAMGGGFQPPQDF